MDTYKNSSIATHRSLDIEIRAGRHALITGSLHKYWNGGTNENDFTYPDLTRTVNELVGSLRLDPNTVRLQNVEFGVNGTTPFYPTDFLQHFITFKGTPFNTITFGGKGYMRECEKQRYYLKAYNKGKQYSLPENRLRFEVKVVKMEHLKYIPVTYLADLLNPANLQLLGRMLNEYFDEVLIYDPSIELGKLRPQDRELVINGSNPAYWQQLNHVNKERYKKHRQRFRQLVKEYGQNQWQKVTSQLIRDKWQKLTKPDTLPKLTDPVHPYNTHINTLYIGLNRGTDTSHRYCLTCGRDITDQRTNSKFCSEKRYGREAKKCRNSNSNPRNNLRRRIDRITAVPMLFDVRPYIRLQEDLGIA